ERLVGKLGRQIRQMRAPGPRELRVVAVFHIAVLHVARLRHEAVDHPVKGHIVIGSVPGKLLDAPHMLGRQIRPQSYFHLPAFKLDHQRVFRLCGLPFGGAKRDACGKTKGCGEGRKAHEVTLRLCPCPFQAANFAFSASATTAGTKGLTSPPMEAICRTSVAVIVRTEGLAGRKTVCRSGAMVSFMPAICIS